MTFSVVVVAHRSRRELENLLPALAGAGEVIVVDTDGSAAGLGATVIDRTDNPGFGAANNVGVERASCEVTLLLNPDITAAAPAVERLAELAAGRDALVVPRLRNPDGSVQRSAFALPGRASGLLTALVPGALRPEPWRSRAPRIVGWALGAAVAAPTALLRRLGPFDPGAFLFYEDMDLCLRARAAGIPTVLHPEVELTHAGAHSYRSAPVDLLAQRRRAVVGANLGPRALRLDDAAQALEFGVRSWRERDRARLRALQRTRG